MQAFPLTGGQPSANSGTLGIKPARRRETHLPSFVLPRQKTYWVNYCWCNHSQSDYWFSWDPQVNVVVHWAFSVQKWDLRTWIRAVLWRFHFYASQPLRRINLLSGELSSVGFIDSFIVFRCEFHLRLRVHPSVHSMSCKNFLILNHNVFLYLFFFASVSSVSVQSNRSRNLVRDPVSSFG